MQTVICTFNSKASLLFLMDQSKTPCTNKLPNFSTDVHCTTMTHIPQPIVISSYNCSESAQRIPLRDLVVLRKLTGVESTLESRPPSTLVSWQDARSGTADTPPHACMHAMEDKGGRVVFPTGCIKSLDICKNGRKRWYKK